MKNATPQNSTFKDYTGETDTYFLKIFLINLVPALESNIDLQKKLKFFPINRFVIQEKFKKGHQELHLPKKTIVPKVSKQNKSYGIIYELANIQFCLESELIAAIEHVFLRPNFYLKYPARKIFVSNVLKIAKGMTKDKITLSFDEEWVDMHIERLTKKLK